ncbi:hypothetical protein HCG49_18265 [Arenibacter sp. 6A1]|uniref:hypothetical protein n=1 Tax=Arenibacter sp. 6A1 TaxID=2720391 RepID=UPI00144593C5|nr:hypothetical protein [Arenibacter sp. 6A1]NKI28497.1 hypothetical protein [Arenibacter sp. 6A1]
MKKLLIAITLLLVVSSLSAQDKIYFNDGSKIEAKVLVVSEVNIQYKKIDNLSGPTFETGLSNINMIVYENGSHQMFNQELDKSKISKKSNSGFRKNRINLDLLAFGENGPTSISYEIINKNGSRGIEIPVNVYFNSDGVVGYTVGANIKYYTNNQGNGFFIGPAIGLGAFDWYGGNYSYYYTSTDFSAYLGIKLGYQFQISDLFGINLAGNGGGISNFDEFDFGYSINLGINFSF